MFTVARNRAPMPARIAAGLDVTAWTARAIREVWRAYPADLDGILDGLPVPNTRAWVRQCFSRPGPRAIKRAACDELAGGYGVEYLGSYRRTGNAVYYSNAGDTYTATLVFIGHRLVVTDWGSLIESDAVRVKED